MKSARSCLALILFVCIGGAVHCDDAVQLTKVDQRAIVEDVLGVFQERYVFPSVAEQMAALVRARLDNGKYEEFTSVDSLADHLSRDLQEISDDGHIIVYRIQSGAYFKADDETLSEEEVARHARDNFGFREVKRLTGNIGYLRLDHFDYAEFGGATASAAMAFVANCDALIMDLRENSGGREEMVQFLLSYLFEGSRQLLTFIDRDDEVVHQTHSLAYVPGSKLADIPVFVLTSRRTASAAEAFSYNLQSHERATIVGEATRGIAHWIDVVDLAEHDLRVNVPYARPVSSVTGGNWEGDGVIPDIEIPAVEALGFAHVRALEELLGACADEEGCRGLEWDLVAARAQAEPPAWNRSLMHAYTGVYADGKYKLHIKDGQLYWRYRPEVDYVLLPLSSDLFAFDDTEDLRFRIIRGADGSVTGYQLVYRNGEVGSVKHRTADLP